MREAWGAQELTNKALEAQAGQPRQRGGIEEEETEEETSSSEEEEEGESLQEGEREEESEEESEEEGEESEEQRAAKPPPSTRDDDPAAQLLLSTPEPKQTAQVPPSTSDSAAPAQGVTHILKSPKCRKSLFGSLNLRSRKAATNLPHVSVVLRRYTAARATKRGGAASSAISPRKVSLIDMSHSQCTVNAFNNQYFGDHDYMYKYIFILRGREREYGSCRTVRGRERRSCLKKKRSLPQKSSWQQKRSLRQQSTYQQTRSLLHQLTFQPASSYKYC